MTDLLSSPTIKSGNVLALLDALYTSGFAMTSPTIPLLKGRTMHTLYAISFIVYVSNCMCDWFHVWATLHGLVTSFPLKNWLVVSLVASVVAGSMLTWLLLVLCMENAFVHRLGVTPYRSGCSLIWEALVEWIQAFNNFRVAFLIMLLHDTPITLLNFFFVASCRCVGPDVVPWSMLLSSSSSIISLLWRITMLYFAYRRMLCPVKPKGNVNIVKYPKFTEHLHWAVDCRDERRMKEYDEFWPIRWARYRAYSRREDPNDSMIPGSDRHEDMYVKSTPSSFFPLPIIGSVLRFTVKSVKVVVCALLSILCYILLLAICCVPCCYHYTCRQNSAYHRHKCSRTFLRYYSNFFHYIVFFLSLLCAVTLIILNLVLISSVHIIGWNTIPPEINRVCISFLPSSQSIHAAILPSPLFSPQSLEKNVNDVFLLSDNKASTVCKPFWEDGELGLGFRRKQAGPWQTRRRFGDRLIAVATQVIVNNTAPEDSYLKLRFDYAILTELEATHNRKFSCARGEQSEWKFIAYLHDTPWPYFLGCQQNWRFFEENLIECLEDPESSLIPRRRGHHIDVQQHSLALH